MLQTCLWDSTNADKNNRCWCSAYEKEHSILHIYMKTTVYFIEHYSAQGPARIHMHKRMCCFASMCCKRIGSVQMTLTWRPLLERVRESRYTNPYLPSGRERCTETETRNKRVKIKWYWDVNRSWRVSCSVRRVWALSDSFNKVAQAVVDISAFQEVSVLGCTGPLSHSRCAVHAICANCNYNPVSFRRAL